MATELERVLREPDAVDQPLLEVLSRLTQAQLNDRTQNQISRLCREAGLATNIAIHDIQTNTTGAFTKRVWANLATMGWLSSGHNLVITGPSGSGKTFVATALAREAITHAQKGRVIYTETRALTRGMSTFSYEQQKAPLRRLGNAKLLVLDAFALHPIDDAALDLLNSIIELRRRHERSTIVCSPLAVADWSSVVDHPALLDQFCSRLFSRYQVIHLPPRTSVTAQAEH
jgi:DNA replication protein DnaC